MNTKITRTTSIEYDISIIDVLQFVEKCSQSERQQIIDTINSVPKVKKEKKEIVYSQESYKFVLWCNTIFDVKYLGLNVNKMYDTLSSKYSKEQIVKAINNAKLDAFWSQNFLSPLKLNNTDKNGVKYIDIFLKLSDGKNKQNLQAGSIKANDTSKVPIREEI